MHSESSVVRVISIPGGRFAIIGTDYKKSVRIIEVCQ